MVLMMVKANHISFQSKISSEASTKIMYTSSAKIHLDWKHRDIYVHIQVLTALLLVLKTVH